MPLTNAGRDHIATTLIGLSVTTFNSGNARIGVGDSTAAFDNTYTDLQGTNKYRKAMDTGYPQRSGNELVFRATFGTEEANFDWNEWGIFNGSSGGTMLNRALEALGVKPNNQSWQFTTTLTVTNP